MLWAHYKVERAPAIQTIHLQNDFNSTHFLIGKVEDQLSYPHNPEQTKNANFQRVHQSYMSVFQGEQSAGTRKFPGMPTKRKPYGAKFQ
jgi:hypothetical protein